MDEADGWLTPSSLMLRFGLHPSMEQVEIHRRKQGATTFAHVATINAQATAGFFQDVRLNDGQTYEYHGVPVGLNGVRGVPSNTITGTPNLDPFPPNGSLLIDRGRARVPDSAHVLELEFSPDTEKMPRPKRVRSEIL